MLNMTVAPATETTLASDLLAVVARINAATFAQSFLVAGRSQAIIGLAMSTG